MSEERTQMLPGDEAKRAQMLEEFLRQQAAELELRQHQAALSTQQDRHSFELAKESLAAQAADKKDERRTRLEQEKQRGVGVLIAMLLVILLVGYAINAGQGEIAKEIVKSLAFLVAGGVGGYGYAQAKNRREGDGDAE